MAARSEPRPLSAELVTVNVLSTCRVSKASRRGAERRCLTDRRLRRIDIRENVCGPNRIDEISLLAGKVELRKLTAERALGARATNGRVSVFGMGADRRPNPAESRPVNAFLRFAMELTCSVRV